MLKKSYPFFTPLISRARVLSKSARRCRRKAGRRKVSEPLRVSCLDGKSELESHLSGIAISGLS